VESGQELHSFPRGSSEAIMHGIAFSPDGRLLGAAHAIWDVDRQVVRHTLNRGRVAPVAFSPDGSLLAVALAGQRIRLWDV
jgi:WD40 repeat protein